MFTDPNKSSLPRPTSSVSASPSGVKPEVSVFDFTDYRQYLSAFYQDKCRRNPSYNQSAFARRAGLGANSRGYLKLVIEGKRNLSPHTTRAFIEALGLSGKGALYFENLVYFNQARTPKDKDFYFERLTIASAGHEGEQFELLKSQYSYCSHWYLVAIRELVALEGFQEDPGWIVSRLRNKITRKEAVEALMHLERLGMIRRNASGKYEQSESMVKFSGGIFNAVIQRLHGEMLDRAKESLTEDAYHERAASFITLSCNYKRLPELKKAIDEFRDQLALKFGTETEKVNTVFQIGFQLFQFTPTPKVGSNEKPNEKKEET